MRVAVITDSTACLPAEMAAQWRLTVIPVQIRIDGHVDLETRVPRKMLIDALRAGRDVSTEPPDPAALFWAYQAAAADGCDAIVSVHISSRQSQTYAHAKQAAERASIPVHVIDSRTTGMSLGYAATTAARVAAAGGDPARIIDALTRKLADCSELLYVDTLEYLRRGGRIGATASLIGTALSLKPLLAMKDGEVAPLEKVLGASRAVRKLVDTAVRRIDGRPVDLAVGHVGAPEQAQALLDTLLPRVPQARQCVIIEASSALAVHLGPGALNISISPT
jgi:DegV family protein with EDD domain